MQPPRPAWIEGLKASLPLVLALLGATFVRAADWPSYRGPTHDGVTLERINKNWTGSVTNPVWLVHLTNGVTSLTVNGGRVFTQVGGDVLEMPPDPHKLPRKEYCVALDAATGAMLWATETEASDQPLYDDGVGYTDDGPRSTPVVSGNSVYVLSSYLKLYRLNVTNGAIIWSTNLVTAFGGSVIGWQNAASPVIENGLLYVNANAPSNSLMAFNATNGALVWRAHNEAMTHSTPVLTTMHGMRQLIWATQSGLVSVNPLTGALLWKQVHPFSYAICIGASPVVYSNYVFITANYGMFGYAARVSLSNTVQVSAESWRAGGIHRSHWSTPVVFEGHMYGTFYPNNADAELRCVDITTGATRWQTNYFGRVSPMLVGTNLLCITERGSLVLVSAKTSGYQELARFEAIPGYVDSANKCWNSMALSDGQLYIRSTAYVARYDLSVPDLRLDSPQPGPLSKLDLTIRTVTGAPVDSNRIPSMEVRASTNAALSASAWTKLTNALVLSNGVVRVTNVDAAAPRRYFIVSEPK